MSETGEVTEPTGIPSPEQAARHPKISGNAVILGDGRLWLLPDYVPQFEDVWDRLYDSNCLTNKYTPDDIRLAASRLLLANYDLTVTAAATLVIEANVDVLVEAVENALFGPIRSHRTWSDWAIGSLIAAGVDPAAVPADRLHAVLDVLVSTGRTIPAGKFISSATAGRMLSSKRARAVNAEPATLDISAEAITELIQAASEPSK